jgi:hypothetical protein
MPGHLIVSQGCCFHMVTDIGHLRVSSIGCYHPASVKQGDRNYANRETIGAGEDAFYETYVFPIDDDGEITEHCELDGERYATEEDAEEGHHRFCQKVAYLDGDPKRLREEVEAGWGA